MNPKVDNARVWRKHTGDFTAAIYCNRLLKDLTFKVLNF